jgi:ABC-type uncharacterized transport system permease subunit
MPSGLILNLAALAGLVPAAVLPFWRQRPTPEPLFWLLIAAALAGCWAYTVSLWGGPWSTGLGLALWVSISTTLSLFAVVALLRREAWRLAALLLPYLLLLGLFATFLRRAPHALDLAGQGGAWLAIHIVLSVVTYGLVTLAAVSGLAVVLTERALKRKTTGGSMTLLPSVAFSESLQVTLLTAAELVLAVGVITGIALDYTRYGTLLKLDHKTLLSLLAFAVIGALLALHRFTGLRGRHAARLVLAAYLLLTLAYPGVKFVSDILIG